NVIQSQVTPSYAGSVYQDQIAFFRNGLLSKLVNMPTFLIKSPTQNPSTYIATAFENSELPYSVYQQKNTEDFNLYSPWGGILGYQPQVYTFDLQSSAGKGIIEGPVSN